MKKIQRYLLLLIVSVSVVKTIIAEPVVPSLTQFTALKANSENGKNVYLTCSLCHSPEGWGTPDGYYPQLSGQHPKVLLKQLIDIQTGKRDVPTMIPFSETVFYQGHQNVVDVVHYISALPMNPENGVGKGDKLVLGEKIYVAHCQKCHGNNGEGINDKYYPRIQGQHYEYLLRQLKWIQNGMRKNGDAEMEKVIATYTNQDMEALADYISRMKPPKALMATSGSWKNPDFNSNFTSAPWLRHK